MNAETALQKFVYIPHEDDKCKGMDKIHIHNGVQCASDRHRAGVIMPDDKSDWDLQDAYLDVINLVEKKVTTGKGKNKKEETVIIEEPATLKLDWCYKGTVDDCEGFKISKSNVKRLIASCKEKQKEYRESLSDLTPKEKSLSDCYGRIYINVEGMEIITEDKARELNHEFGKVGAVSFNIKYFRDALEFILCSGDDEIHFWYKSNITPFVMKSAKLYALVMPVRIN